MPREVCLSEFFSEEPSLQSGYIKVAVSVITALLVAAIGQGIVVWRDNSVLSAGVESLQRAVEANTAALRVLAQQSAENTIYRAEHARSAEEWYRRISELEHDVHSLQRQPSARPDPFTGTEGRELERRIRKLEGSP